jgi:hypothetical protein
MKKNQVKPIDMPLSIGIILSLFSIVSGVFPDKAPASVSALYSQGLFHICTGSAGLVGGGLILYSLIKKNAAQKRINERCVNCGAELHSLEDLYCHICGTELHE